MLALALACGPGSVSDSGELGELGDGGESGESGSGDCSLIGAEVPAVDRPEACVSYLGDPPLEQPPVEVEVELVNARDEAILLLDQGEGCDHDPRWFLLEGSYQGREVWLSPTNSACEWPACANFSDAPPSCPDCGTTYSPIYIAPGGRWRTTWTAVALIDVELPASCSVDGTQVSCWAPTPLPPGDYQLRAVAAPASDCMAEDCGCEVDEHGSCPSPELPSPDFPSSPSLEASVTWTASCDAIELRFEA